MTGFSYIFVFIAGAITTGALVAMTVVESMSSAIPFAIFPITFAVAGAIKKISAFFAKDICSISQFVTGSNISTATGFWLML